MAETTDTKNEKSDSNNSEFSENINTEHMAEVLGIDEDLIIDDLNMTNLEKEENVYLKSDLSDEEGHAVDMPDDGDTITFDDGTEDGIEITCEVIDNTGSGGVDSFISGVSNFVTGTADTTTQYTVKSEYLGDFTFDASEFELRYKEVEEEDGSISKLPYLAYIGSNDGIDGMHADWEAFGTDELTGFDFGSGIDIPDGLKVMDYMFANNTIIHHVPKIPDSVTSMHCAFENCSNLENVCDDAKTIKGKAGEYANIVNGLNLPDGLEDLSCAFKNCSEFESAFNELPEGVLNITSAWEGADKIGEAKSFLGWEYNFSLPEYGEDITKYLTSYYAKDALNNSNELAKEQADSTEFYINDDGTINGEVASEMEDATEDAIDESKVAQSQIFTRLHYLTDIDRGDVSVDSELSSNGARSNNYYYDATDEKIHDDTTGLMVSDDKASSLTELWQKAAIDGTVGLGIGGLVGNLFGDKFGGTVGFISGAIAGVGGAAALDYFNIIPDSLTPIVNWVAEKLPDGDLKTKLEDLVEEWSGSDIKEQEEALTAENVAATYQNRRAQRSFYGIKGTYELDGNVDESMYNNAEYCGANLNFKASADAALQYGEDDAMAGVHGLINETTSSMEIFWKSQIENGTYTADSEQLKSNMKDYYVSLMQSLESYNEGAQAGIATLSNDAYKSTSQEGLNMMNRAYTEEVMESLIKMNDTYNFMDEDAWNQITSVNVSGIDAANLKNYNANYFDTLSSESIINIQTIIAEAGEDYAVGTSVGFGTKGDDSFENKNVQKSVIERIVASILTECINDPVLRLMIAERVYEYYQRVYGGDDNYEASIQNNIKDCDTKLNNIMRAIEAGIFNETTQERMKELQVQKKAYEDELKAEKNRQKYALKPENVVRYLESFIGNINEPSLRDKVLNCLVDKICVYNDKMVISFYYSDDKREVDIEAMNEELDRLEILMSMPDLSNNADNEYFNNFDDFDDSDDASDEDTNFFG